jgi:hypothetical protein
MYNEEQLAHAAEQSLDAEIVRAEMNDLHRTLTQCGVPEQIPPFKAALAPAKARVLYLSARCNQLFDEAANAQECLDQFEAHGTPNVAAALDRIAAAEARAAKLEEALRSIAANTCCDRCQEAALVARAAIALSAPEKEVRP